MLTLVDVRVTQALVSMLGINALVSNYFMSMRIKHNSCSRGVIINSCHYG